MLNMIRVLSLCLTVLLGCAPQQAAGPAQLQSIVLPGSDGRAHDLSRVIEERDLTVLVFYSEGCSCVSAHEPRLAQIHEDYGSRGVQLFMVNSEVGAESKRDAAEAKRRGYPFVLLTDTEARLAKAVSAKFAAHAIVLDARGRVRYSGSIDSDKAHLRDDATPHLRNALDELLAGRAPEVSSSRAFGCTLQLY